MQILRHLHEQHKFISAHAHSHIFHPADGKQYICCFFQHSITELMSPAIIDRFEFIHIKDKQRVFLILS